MIRFYEDKPADSLYMDIAILSESIILGKNVWDEGKELFRKNLDQDIANVKMVPVTSEKGEIIGYAYQDAEANRELRMLRELEKHKETLQFKEIFPQVKEVIVYGCNELAYRFVQYLERQRVHVSVEGKYWEHFSIETSGNTDCDNNNKMVVYAEFPFNIENVDDRIIKSVSSEFECIDRIYESNVKAGKIKDTVGDLGRVLEKLRGKRVVVLGTSEKAQDTYDFLYAHGIDIYCFAVWKVPYGKTLLGKKIVAVSETLCDGEDLFFVNCYDRNSALGSKDVEIFDYYGYTRNEKLFLVNDYADIPHSNLVHVLKGKSIRLVGREVLCTLLADYLKDVEQGDIDVRYVELSQCMSLKETDILCIVHLWFGDKTFTDNPKVFLFREELAAMAGLSYTDYFSRSRVFVMIDLYRNRDKEKYSVKKLLPRGILLGRIPGSSGNILFRGILDGHPNIVKWGYNTLNNNLFLQCICLANERPERILTSFKNMLEDEYGLQLERNIACWDEFQRSAQALLSLKAQFSSQELFIIFHIAYAEMISGEKITDIYSKVIYWEPHMTSRAEFPFFAWWLEDEKINGQTIYMHRDNVVWANSCYKYYKENPFTLEAINNMSRNDMIEEEEAAYRHWTEFHVRFEDIKLHPRQELSKICDRFEIPWSDVMLRTTDEGEPWDFEGIIDFDVKPVFNKYEEYMSEVDRFRISLLSSAYQKMYGYTYESCMKFSRKELWELFLKKFRFQEKLQFENEKDMAAYYLQAYERMRWDLWKVRKHEVLDDIVPKLDKIDIGQSTPKQSSKSNVRRQPRPTREEMDKLVEFARRQEKLVLYGIGRDCEALLKYLDGRTSELLFCDAQAAYRDTVFRGSKVIAPEELCRHYGDYKILVTSSRYYKTIHRQLTELGVGSDRIVCNTFQLWEEEK